MCSKGGIYSEDKCPICNGGMLDNRRDAVVCPDHPQQQARSFTVRFGRAVKRRFKTYGEAFRFLTGLRFKTDEGTYDEREYAAHDPLGFANLVKQYVGIKEKQFEAGQLSKGTINPIRHELGLARRHFGNVSVKTIKMPHLQEFFLAQKHLSGKSVHNIRTNLHAFWKWLVDSEVISLPEMPKFPDVSYVLGWRKVVDKETQDAILDQVRELTMPLLPRVYMAIRWLCIYTSIRPVELLRIRECDVDYQNGLLVLADHKTARKTREPKIVPLLPRDVESLKALPRSIDREAPLFRHDFATNSNIQAGDRLGGKILYRYWKKACEILGITDVDLYGGTRHSTSRYYKQSMSTEDVQRLSMHTTSKAALRYIQVDDAELLKGYALADSHGTQKKSAGTPGTPAVHGRKAVKAVKALK